MQFVEVVFVRLGELGLDIDKIHDAAVAVAGVRAVHPRERLEQVVRLDDTAEVELLQACGIEAGEQHVEDEEDVDLAFLEGFHQLLAVRLGACVMQDEGVGSDGALGQCVERGGFGDLLGSWGCRWWADEGGHARILLFKNPRHFLRLLGGITDDHGTSGEVVLHHAGVLEILDDVVEHGLDKLRVGIDHFPVFRGGEQLDLLQGLFELHLILRFDLLANQAQRVAIGDGTVVIVFVDVVPKDQPRVVGHARRGVALVIS